MYNHQKLGSNSGNLLLRNVITSLFSEFRPKVQLEWLIFDEINYIVTLLNAARDREKKGHMIAKSRKTRIGNKIRIQSDLTNFQIHFLDDFHDFCEFLLVNDQIRISLFYLQVIVRWKHWDGCTCSCYENCKNDDQGSQPASTN